MCNVPPVGRGFPRGSVGELLPHDQEVMGSNPTGTSEPCVNFHFISFHPHRPELTYKWLNGRKTPTLFIYLMVYNGSMPNFIHIYNYVKDIIVHNV